jgi:hypothetical protein
VVDVVAHAITIENRSPMNTTDWQGFLTSLGVAAAMSAFHAGLVGRLVRVAPFGTSELGWSVITSLGAVLGLSHRPTYRLPFTWPMQSSSAFGQVAIDELTRLECLSSVRLPDSRNATLNHATSCHSRAAARPKNSITIARQRRWAMRTDVMRPSNEAPLSVCNSIERAPWAPGGFL